MNQFEGDGGSVTEKTKGLAEQAKSRASSTVKEQMDTRSTQAADQLQRVAGSMRLSSDELREQAGEAPAKVNDVLAEKIEQLSRYLRDADGDKMLADFENLARRRPWMITGAATLIGFTLSRFLKASGRNRYEQQFDSTGRELSTARPPVSPEDEAAVVVEHEAVAVAGPLPTAP